MQPEDKKKVYDILLFNFAFLLAIWAIFLLDKEFAWGLTRHGNHPRRLNGLTGILSMPFLHGGFDHIRSNSMSFFVLSAFLIFFYRQIAFPVLGFLYIGSGILLWLWGGSGNHIGASGVIYGIAAFIFFSGLIRKNPALLRVALAVAFLYGSMVWWVLPIDKHISWEGHLAGGVMGLVLALAYKNKGPQRKVYDWESDPQNDDDFEVEYTELVGGQEVQATPVAEGEKKNPSTWQSTSTDGSFKWDK